MHRATPAPVCHGPRRPPAYGIFITMSFFTPHAARPPVHRARVPLRGGGRGVPPPHAVLGERGPEHAEATCAQRGRTLAVHADLTAPVSSPVPRGVCPGPSRRTPLSPSAGGGTASGAWQTRGGQTPHPQHCLETRPSLPSPSGRWVTGRTPKTPTTGSGGRVCGEGGVELRNSPLTGPDTQVEKGPLSSAEGATKGQA